MRHTNRISAPHSLVVGGTNGLGLVVAKRFAEQGHRTSVIGRRAIDKSMAPGVSVWRTNLSNGAALRTTLRKICAQGGAIDNLVFCQRYRLAGDDWEGEIATSLTAVKIGIDTLQRKFRRGGGAIVVIGSIAGRMVATEQPLSYHVAKGGLLQLVRYYAVRMGGLGVRVNCVSPGAVVKDEARALYERNRSLVALHERIIPLGRAATTDEVSNVVMFLCDARSAYVTGQEIVVDGGLSLVGQESVARDVGAVRVPRRPVAKGRRKTP